MADLVERLLGAIRDETQSSTALLKEAADEIERLRKEYKRMSAKLEQNNKFGEPEF